MDSTFLQTALSGLNIQWQTLVYIGVALLCALAATFLIHLLLRKGKQRPLTGERVWHDAILGTLNAPLQILVWVIALSLVETALNIGERFPGFAEVFPSARAVVVIAVAAWFLMSLARRALDNLAVRAKINGKGLDATAADAIAKCTIAAIIIVAVMAIMQSLGFPIASLLALGGVMGIAIGFAAQGLVANLIGGITIFASHPFKVGDNIILPGIAPGGGYIGWQAGEVEYIGWRATRIRDWNGKPLYVPNSEFNTKTVINHSRMSYREFSQTICIRMEDIDKVAAIAADVNQMLEQHPDMGDYIVFKLDGFSDFAIQFYFYAYTVSTITAYTDFMRVKQDVLLKIADIIAQHGAKLAVPVSTVYAPEGLALLQGKLDPSGAGQ